MAEETPNPVPDDQNQKDPLQTAPKTPLEHILSVLWKSKVGRLVSLIIGLVAIISLIAPTITLIEQTWDRLTARHKVDSAATSDLSAQISTWIKNGYYVEHRRTIYNLEPWTDVPESRRNEKISLGICYGEFRVHRESRQALNFIQRISTTSNIEPDIFVNKPYQKLPVENSNPTTKVWEVRTDISHEVLHDPFMINYVVLFWNSFNKPTQWDAGTGVL